MQGSRADVICCERLAPRPRRCGRQLAAGPWRVAARVELTLESSSLEGTRTNGWRVTASELQGFAGPPRERSEALAAPHATIATTCGPAASGALQLPTWTASPAGSGRQKRTGRPGSRSHSPETCRRQSLARVPSPFPPFPAPLDFSLPLPPPLPLSPRLLFFSPPRPAAPAYGLPFAPPSSMRPARTARRQPGRWGVASGARERLGLPRNKK